MIYSDRSWKEALKSGCSLFCFYSSQEAQLNRMSARTIQALQGEDTELTVLEGPNPGVEEAVMAAGTISFFGTRRVVSMPMVKVSAYSDKDLDAFCDLFDSLENAAFVITIPVNEEWGKLRLGKREQKFIAACEKAGYCAQLVKLQAGQLVQYLQDRAKEQDTQLEAPVARMMMDRCGEDQLLLENEVDKLAALSGYTAITREMVEQLGTQSLDADTFDMIGLLVAGRLPAAMGKLDLLLKMQQEPIAILGAMISNYLDLYRLSCGSRAKAGVQQVHKDFRYKGSDYRLRKADSAARQYSRKQLRSCLGILEETDRKLKSSPMDSRTLLETALFRLAAAREER